MTIFNQEDREYLLAMLYDALSITNLTAQEIKQTIADCKQLNNANLSRAVVKFVPEILNDLDYNRSRR